MPNHPRRICHIAYTFYESDNRVLRYVQALSARGDQVDVVSLRPAGQGWRETAGGVRFYRVQRRSTTEKGALTYLLKILWFWLKSMSLVTALQLRRRYQAVHIHNVPDFLVFTAWLPKLMGARVILDIHDVLPELYAGKFNVGQTSGIFKSLLAVERASCRFADHVIVANHLWHERLIGRSVPGWKCTTFMNYPDLSVFKPAPATAATGQSRFLILYPGSLNHHQGLDIAVRAFASVHPEMPGAEFHIYGRGPALPELVRLTHKLGVDHLVKFMEGVGLTQIAAIMASASVGVVPKRADGFGNEAFSTKILEFMACGVPVVVARTRVDGYYFDDRVVSFFEPGNAEDLGKVLVQNYRDRNNQQRKIAAAQELANRLSWQVHADDYRSLVDSLIASASFRQSAPVQETR